MMTRKEATDQGFIVDSCCYPHAAYKGDRFRPTEIHDVMTDVEATMLSLLRNLLVGKKVRLLNNCHKRIVNQVVQVTAVHLYRDGLYFESWHHARNGDQLGTSGKLIEGMLVVVGDDEALYTEKYI